MRQLYGYQLIWDGGAAIFNARAVCRRERMIAAARLMLKCMRDSSLSPRILPIGNFSVAADIFIEGGGLRRLGDPTARN